MDVKEEAKKLIDKFRKHVDCDLSGEDGFEYSKDAETYNAKQCALIVVDEIIKALMYPPQLNEYRQVIHIKVLQYWKELKKEIEKE
jgi:hypothetical protein